MRDLAQMNFATPVPRPAPLRVLLACACLLAGCTRSNAQDPRLPDAEARGRHAVQVREVAVSEAGAELTSVNGLDVDRRGRVFVGDWYRQQVTVLAPDGTVLRRFGRRGDGPGEFRSIRGVQVLPGDSVLVYDPTLGRVTVYPPDSVRPAYTAGLASSGPPPFHLWRTAANDGYVALFRPPFMFMEGRTPPVRRDALRLLSLTGAARAAVREFPSRGFLVAGSSVMPDPFGREGLIASDSRGDLFFLWSDSLAIDRFGPDGAHQEGVRLSHPPRAVTPGDVRRAMEAWDAGTRATFARVLQDSVPAHWPAATALRVDDRDRVWIALAAGPGEPTEWLVLSPELRYLASVRLPPRTTLHVVRGDQLYVHRLDDEDVPVVVTYRAAGLPE